MNADSAEEDGAGPENLQPNGAPEGRATDTGRRPASAAGQAFAGFGVESRSDWLMWAEALSGR